jgi:thiol-disulfide isomerase/thioredoxin
MRHTITSLVALGLLAALAGCARDDNPKQAAKPNPNSNAVAKATAEPSCCDDNPPSQPATRTSQKPNDAIQLDVIKYPQLVEAVKAHKGKVVVVDVWATFCIPCKKEFPHLVELHRDLASAGVVCMSVTIDEKDKVEAALKFLREQGATFPNYLLDEDAAVWQEKWAINGVPAVFVFARDGKQAAKFDSDADKEFSYKDVRKKVEELLK